MDNVDLSTLNILSWPETYERAQPPKYYASTMAPALARLATDILTTCRSERLYPYHSQRRFEIVAFGLREICPESSYAIPKYFVEGEVRGLRYTKAAAVPADLRVLDEEGLATEILHHEWRQFDKESTHVPRRFYMFDETELDES